MEKKTKDKLLAIPLGTHSYPDDHLVVKRVFDGEGVSAVVLLHGTVIFSFTEYAEEIFDPYWSVSIQEETKDKVLQRIFSILESVRSEEDIKKEQALWRIEEWAKT